MKRKSLRHGYTTGACATAAAKGAAIMLRDRQIIGEVEITLPCGEKVLFRLNGQQITDNAASCFVVKDAGDDPDVTNGAEIHATVMLNPPSPPFAEGGNDLVIVEGGVGIGKVTKPGLAVPVGEWAINPVPRRMITEAVGEVFPPSSPLPAPRVVISIPNGEELAKKTLNARLGIIGGLSILGTTGIVTPISARAWTDTIEAAIDVALACGCDTLVLSTGRTSEQAAQRFFSMAGDAEAPANGNVIRNELSFSPFALCPLPAESFIMMGDHVGYAIRACARKGARDVVIAGQFAKLLKIACGHEQTHVSASKLDLQTLTGWLKTSLRNSQLAPHALNANTAREVLEGSGNDPELIAMVCAGVLEFARKLAPGARINVLLAGYHGEVLYYGPD